MIIVNEYELIIDSFIQKFENHIILSIILDAQFYLDQLDVLSSWFFVDYVEDDIRYSENIVIGDNIFSDGLRVISFATKHSLNYLSRSTLVLGDGTFKVTFYSSLINFKIFTFVKTYNKIRILMNKYQQYFLPFLIVYYLWV